MNVPEMATIKQVAERANVPEYAVRRWVRDGVLRSVKSGNRSYIAWASVMKFLSGDDLAEESVKGSAEEG